MRTADADRHAAPRTAATSARPRVPGAPPVWGFPSARGWSLARGFPSARGWSLAWGCPSARGLLLTPAPTAPACADPLSVMTVFAYGADMAPTLRERADRSQNAFGADRRQAEAHRARRLAAGRPSGTPGAARA